MNVIDSISILSVAKQRGKESPINIIINKMPQFDTGSFLAILTLIFIIFIGGYLILDIIAKNIFTKLFYTNFLATIIFINAIRFIIFIKRWSTLKLLLRPLLSL